MDVNYSTTKSTKSTKDTKEKRSGAFLQIFVLFVLFVAKQVRFLLLFFIVALLPAMPVGAQTKALDTTNSDVVLVIDNSGSMKENDPNYLRLAAAKLFVDLADPGDKISIVVLSDKNRTRSLNKKPVRVFERAEVDELKQQIDAIRSEPMGEQTHMGTALNQAYDLLELSSEGFNGANRRQFVILLSDGLPTGTGQEDLVKQAADRFRERRFWKIFPIALGADAKPEYLRANVADPSGGDVVVANSAGDLINSYLDVYTRAGDDRYVDRVEVQPNTLAPLVDVAPDHQATHVSVVFIRGEGGGSIRSLDAPGESDVVQPFYQNTVRRGAEPEYELYTVPPEAQVGLVGQWSINVERADPNPVTVVVLSRSKLRVRMPLPAPLSDEDDTGLRYHPVGRPMLLVTGAQVAQRNPDSTPDKPYDYKWVSGMQPTARIVGAGDEAPVALQDDGVRYDSAANDGRYSGLLPAISTAGDYTVEIELPRGREQPIHVRKDYTVRVAPLPVMQITPPLAATTLPLNAAFSATIALPGSADFQIEQVTFPTAFIQRPDGVLDQITIEPEAEGRYRFNYTPNFVGPYSASIVAEVRGRGPMGAIRYVDYAEMPIAVPTAVPQITISPAFTETLTYDSSGLLNVPLRIRSESKQQEALRVQIEQIGGAPVQDQVLVEPNEAAQRTIAVRLPDGARPSQGELTLVFSAPDQRVIVEGSRVNVAFKARSGLLLVALLFVVVLVSGGFLLYRRWKASRAAHLAAVPSAPRRFS